MQIVVKAKPSFEELGRRFKGVELDKAMHDIITKFAFSVESYSKQVTPVDTGRLRSSIGTGFLITNGIGKGGVARVAPHTEYAGWVHDGTRRMKARPFMQWGVDFAEKREAGQIPRRLDEHLRRKLSNL